ncbi:MAG: 4Fe-4S binding protein [Anaerolineales bacterium]|nr:4Fe-4S binding protein [Anaerolineales bacterium]
MTADVYQRLARHLDQLPGGFPPTQTGVELRILERLFTPAEAELALRLTLIPERAAVVARRAGMDEAQALAMLSEMALKGLILETSRPGRPPRFMALHFVVGIWEFQVNRLTPELVRDVDEYFATLFDPQIWQKAPQLRTIPVGEALAAPSEVLLYENAEAMLRRGARFAVTPCICRQERQLAGEGCGKPLETCLSLDGAADGAIRQGRGRAITLEEALHILQSANCAGLVLQPGNSKDAQYFCCCCGDCCGVLRNVKRHPQPGRLISSAFYAVSAAALCSGCGECLERCQMDAISLAEGWAAVDRERCIGCGLCVTTCPSGALRLERKPAAELPHVPDNSLMMYLQLARARGVLGPSEIARTALQSGIDRLRAK